MTYHKIISFDGGGIRGAISAKFIEILERKLNRSVYNIFDSIAGTSTGGLIALNIAANKASGRNCTELYSYETANMIMNKSIFDRFLPVQNKPKYDGKGKRLVLSRLFQEKRILDVKKDVLVTSFDIITRKSVVFKSYGGSASRYNPKIAQIADATSAAPSFFPTIAMDMPKRWLIDGGFCANDPSICAVSEAIKKGIDVRNIKLVSIGTGIARRGFDNPSKYGEASKKWGGVGWLQNGLIDNLLSGNSSSTEYFCKTILGNNYIKINAPLTKASDDIDDTSRENLDRLNETAIDWYKEFGSKLEDFIG